jgi:hypothetical protein
MGSNNSGSESSSGNSDSYESEDEDKPKRKSVRKVVKKAAPKKKAASPKKKASPKAKSTRKPSASKSTPRSKKVDPESEDEVAMEDSGNQNEVKVLKQVQTRTAKEQLVADILCRWWYVMPDWPPVDFDFASTLKANKLRLVPLDKWEDEPDVDASGFMKCYALTQYKGLFRDAAENLRDLRPLEGKPCFSQLIKKSDKELEQTLSAALTKQIEVLSASQEKKKESILADLKDRLRNVGKKK